MFDNQQTGNNLARILRLAILDPSAAADELDVLADKLRKIAEQLREAAQKNDSDYLAPGGMGTRAKVKVVGPDGELKQAVTAYN